MQALYQPTTLPLRGGWTRHPPAKCCHHNRRETSETIATSLTTRHPLNLSPIHLSFSPQWRSRTKLLHLPSFLPLLTQSWAALCIYLSLHSSSSVSSLLHPKKERPLRLSVSLFSFLERG